MKKNTKKKFIVLLLLVMLLATGCTKTLKDSDKKVKVRRKMMEVNEKRKKEEK